jgi:CRP-like cAMP-binding protein
VRQNRAAFCAQVPGIPLVTSSNIVVRDELILGRRELAARFRVSPSYTAGAKERLTCTRSSNTIYHLIAGWACRVRDFPDGHYAIVDVYLPGDVIGLDGMLFPRTLAEVMTLTSIATEVIDTEGGLADLMSCRCTALYVAWLLARSQRRSDRFLAAISRLDARGRLATMVLDFYQRLQRQGLITGSTYNLPLTQTQIGAYLGMTVAHVNRVIGGFRDEQIANLEKHSVTIFDLQSLARLAQSTATARSPADRSCATAFALFQAQAPSGDGVARDRGEDHVLSIPLRP